MSKQLNFGLSGTTCASCELLIERTLKQLPGVRRVNASHNEGTLTLIVNDEATISQATIAEALQPHGYRLRNPKAPKDPLQLDLKRLGGAVIVIFALYVFLRKTGFLTYSPELEGPTSMLAVLGIGLVAAFSSCTAVVGGLIAGFSSARAKYQEHLSFTAKILPHLLFNLGRLIGFVVLGAAVGWVGQSLSLSTTANGLFVLIIALVMIMLGINLIGVFSRPVFAIRPPKFLASRVNSLTESNNPFIPMLAGAGTFFLPCGFTQSMQLYALSLGDPKAAAITMGLFALGTLPALLGIGALTSSAKGAWLQKISRGAGALIIVLGISNAQNGAALLDIRLPSRQSEYAAAETPINVVNGEQVIKMRVTSAGTYEPSVLTVQAGTPVRWEVTGDNYMGCGSSLVLRAFGVSTNLKPGPNVVRFTPTKTGSFTYTCSMGMFRGTMVVKAAN